MSIMNYVGYCPICEKQARFVAENDWFRDSLICQSCNHGSVPRERSLALILKEIFPNWRNLSIHESSPAARGISLQLAQECAKYVGSQYYPDRPFGSMVGNFRNENLEHLTFNADTFDITITLDVMEHIYNPDLVISEIWRTLKSGGAYICTFPVRKAQVIGWERRFENLALGSRRDFKEPEMHGNPIDGSGSIVTIDWGYDLHKEFSSWAPFDVRVMRFNDYTHGILGEYTEVLVCRKRNL